PSDTQRVTDDESLGDLVYTLTNPVESGLVKWGRLWPGFTTMGWRFGETRTFKRPDWFFDEEGETPEEASLTLVRPPIFPELDDDALYEKLMGEVRRRELEFQRQIRRENRRFMGPRKLAKQSWRRSRIPPVTGTSWTTRDRTSGRVALVNRLGPAPSAIHHRPASTRCLPPVTTSIRQTQSLQPLWPAASCL
ncbi:MAG: hypothetical protein R6X02_26700, partial [Enhygromyxa sp.]